MDLSKKSIEVVNSNAKNRNISPLGSKFNNSERKWVSGRLNTSTPHRRAKKRNYMITTGMGSGQCLPNKKYKVKFEIFIIIYY